MEVTLEGRGDLPGRGAQIGSWRLVSLLGSGGSGWVWRAEDVHDSREVAAIKLIRSLNIENSATRFRREAGFLRRLRHEHIVSFRDSGVLPEYGLLYLVMDLVEGEPLDAWIAGPPRDPEVVRELFVGLTDALKHAHAHGIVHRDLKPPNIIVRPDGSGCVIDFGIAKEDGSAGLTRESRIPGTLGYFPPELFSRRGPIDGRLGDIYALGVILYESLTGRVAFPLPDGVNDKQTTAALISQKLQHPVLDPGGDVPSELRELVLLATDPDPDLRLASMSGFHRALGGGVRSGAPGGHRLPLEEKTVWYGGDQETEDAGVIELPPDVNVYPGQRRVVEPGLGHGASAGLPTAPEMVKADFEPLEVGRPVLPRHKRPRLRPEPSPQTGEPSGSEAKDASEEDASTMKVLVLAALAGTGGALVLALALVVFLMPEVLWGDADPGTQVQEPPPTVAGTLALVGASDDIYGVWVDGLSITLDGDRTEVTGLALGERLVTIASGDGCEGEPPERTACCEVVSHAVSLTEDASAGEVSLAVDKPAMTARELRLTITGLEDGQTAKVMLDGTVLAQTEEGWYATDVALGQHELTLDVGGCTEADRGCSEDDTCPAGCGSSTQALSMLCGEEPMAMTWPAPSVQARMPTGVATPRPSPVRTPRQPTPTPTPTPTPEETPAPLTVKIVVTSKVTKGPLTSDALQAAAAEQNMSLDACYRRFLRGGSDPAKESTYAFKVLRNGTVDVKSIRRVRSSQEALLDSCTRSAVSALNIRGSKRAGEGTLKVRYEAK